MLHWGPYFMKITRDTRKFHFAKYYLKKRKRGGGVKWKRRWGGGGGGEPVSSETSGFILFIEWKLEEVHIVKIKCIQHEHTHTHMHTHPDPHMNACTCTHTHTSSNIYVCVLQMFVPISCDFLFLFFFCFWGGGGGGGFNEEKRRSHTYILNSLSHELVSVFKIKVLHIHKYVQQQQNERLVLEFNASHTQCI